MPGEKKRIPTWESELWYWVTSSDGKHCPLYNHCDFRQRGGCCLDDSRKHVNLLVESEQSDSSSYDFIKGAPLCMVFESVERLTEKYLEMGRICQPPVPSDIVWLADDQHPVEVRQTSLKVYHGAIWRLREGWVIQLKSDDTSATKRFTLFHKAFHILAHRRATPVFSKRGDREHAFNEWLNSEEDEEFVEGALKLSGIFRRLAEERYIDTDELMKQEASPPKEPAKDKLGKADKAHETLVA